MMMVLLRKKLRGKLRKRRPDRGLRRKRIRRSRWMPRRSKLKKRRSRRRCRGRDRKKKRTEKGRRQRLLDRGRLRSRKQSRRALRNNKKSLQILLEKTSQIPEEAEATTIRC